MIEARWDLPEHWKWVAARDVGEITGGGTPSTGDSANFANKGIPWITPADLTGYAGKYISRGSRDLSEKGYNSSGAKLMPPGTVLFSSRAPIGYCVIASNELATNQGFKSLVSSSEHSPEYLRYYFLSAKEYAESLASGTTFKELSGARMANLAIPVPPLPEQRRIVVKLDSLTGRTARAREELGRIPRLIQKYREAILAAAFRGELTRDWRQTHVPKRVDDDIGSVVRRERDAQRAKTGVRPKGKNRSITGRAVTLPAIPLQWAWVTFDDCAWDLTVGHVGPMKDRYVASGIPFLRSLNIKPNQIDWQSKTVFIDRNFHTELSKSRLRPGDLVVVRTGEPGVAAVVPQSLIDSNCSDLVIGRLIRSMNPHYAAFYMNSEFAKAVVRDAQVDVAQQHFNVGSMSEMPVPWAPTAEQEEIVRKIEMAFVWLDRVVAEHANASRLLPKLDQAILAKAFRGELVTQDPNDKPSGLSTTPSAEARDAVIA